MTKLRHQQPSLWHPGLTKDIEDLWETAAPRVGSPEGPRPAWEHFVRPATRERRPQSGGSSAPLPASTHAETLARHCPPPWREIQEPASANSVALERRRCRQAPEFRRTKWQSDA